MTVVHVPLPVLRWASRLRQSRSGRHLSWVLVAAAVCVLSAWSVGITQPTIGNLTFLDASLGLIFVAAAKANGARLRSGPGS